MKYKHIMIDIPECDMMTTQESVTDWRPGKRIEFHRDAISMPVGCLAMLLIIPALTLACGYLANAFGFSALIAGAVIVLEVIVVVIPFMKGSGRKHFVLDWDENRIDLRHGRRLFRGTLDDIQAIVIETEQHATDPIESSAVLQFLTKNQEYDAFQSYQTEISPTKSAAALINIAKCLTDLLDIPMKLQCVINDRNCDLQQILSLGKSDHEIAERYVSLGSLVNGYRLSCEYRGLSEEAEIHRAEAVFHWMRAHQLDPSLAEPLLRLSQISDDQDLQHRAIQVAMEATDDSQPRIEMARHHFRNGQLDTALKQLTTIIDEEPSAEAYSLRANVYESLDRIQDAVDDMTAAIDQQPEDPVNYSNRGRLLTILHEDAAIPDLLDRAVHDYDQAIRLDPDSVAFQIACADVYAKQGRHDEALAEFNRIVESDRRDSWRWLKRGQFFLADGRWPEKAISDFTQSIKLLERETPAENSLSTRVHRESLAFSYELRADAHRLIGNLPAADEDEVRAEKLYDGVE